jgi:UDP:flavonoid glycosyltransferase YjiC (YdhE family)
MFAALAAHGHTYPSIPLAVAARQAGHEVIYAAGERFLPSLRNAGLHAVPAGISIAEAFAGVAPSPEAVGQVIGDVLPRRWVADLVPLLEAHRPDLLVHDIGTIGAGLAGLVAGVPVLAHTFGRMFSNDMSDSMMAAFTTFAAELGVSSADAAANPVIGICPESVQDKEFRARNDRTALRPAGWSEPGELPPGVRNKTRPLVYVTFGTAYATADLLRQTIHGVAALPVDVLVGAGPMVDVEALGGVPDNVRLEAWVPQAELLPYVDLVVHHGGNGTMLGAFAAGVPQLIAPQGADQFANAGGVLDAGAGDRLLPDEFGQEAVTEKVQALLKNSSAQAAARSVAEEIAAMPSPEDVAARIFVP